MTTREIDERSCGCGCGGRARNLFVRGHNRLRYNVAELLRSGVREPSGCLLWPGRKDRKGYGQVGIRQSKVHRVAWQITNGPILNGASVLHRCDVPLCIEPSHLFLGDQTTNMADMVAKCRQARGSVVHGAKLHDGNVGEIKQLIGMRRFTRAEIARRFGVARQTIVDIATGDTWGHINESV